MKPMKPLSLLAIISLAYAAVTPPQLGLPTGSALIAIVGGRFVPVQVGRGVTLSQDAAGVWMITVTATPPPVLLQAVLLRDTAGNYSGPSGAVYRNGIYQTPGLDYTGLGGDISPTQPWEASDIVSVVSLR